MSEDRTAIESYGQEYGRQHKAVIERARAEMETYGTAFMLQQTGAPPVNIDFNDVYRQPVVERPNLWGRIVMWFKTYRLRRMMKGYLRRLKTPPNP